MTLFRSACVLVLWGGAAACSAHSAHSDMDDIHDQIQAMREEVTHHHSSIMDGDSLPEVLDEVGRHRERMDMAMGHMDSKMKGLGHCGGAAMTRMERGMQDMRGALERHGESMSEAEDVEDARLRCSSHADAVGELIDGMAEAMGDMHGKCM